MYQTPKLSLLVCSLSSREKYLSKLVFNLNWQRQQLANPADVEILPLIDNGEMTIGEKRNMLMEASKGKAFSFIDDDDDVTPYYIKYGLKFADSGCDCASLKGMYYEDGIFYKPFVHDNKYNDWINDNPEFYIRTPNHLNFWKKETVIGEKFNHVNFGEDGEWSMRIKNKGLVKSQFQIDEVLYHYYKITSKGI